jgi:hypothetical protein
MAKRFTDSLIWEKEWFMNLPPHVKCLVKYVRDKCDCAGIWNPNFKLASVYIGETVTEEMLLTIDNGKQFKKLEDGKIYCIDFIQFQYGSNLNPASPVHRKILSIIDKHKIKQVVSPKVDKEKRFVKPTVDELIEHFKTKIDESQAITEAEKFFNYYESVSWKVGKNKMKNWKAAVVNWCGRMKQYAKPKPVSIDEIQMKLQAIGNTKYSDL